MIILVLYSDIRGLSRIAAQEKISEEKEILRRSLESDEEVIRVLVIAINGQTRLECVYPNNFKPEDSQRIIELLEGIEKEMRKKLPNES